MRRDEKFSFYLDGCVKHGHDKVGLFAAFRFFHTLLRGNDNKLSCDARRRQAKNMRLNTRKTGIRTAPDHSRKPTNEGILTPRSSAMALTMKFGAFPI